MEINEEYKFNTSNIEQITVVLLNKFYLEGLSNEEVANKLGISLRSVFRLYKKYNISKKKLSKNEIIIIERIKKKGYTIKKE